MIKINTYLIATGILLTSLNSLADSVVVHENLPNSGDTTTVTTYSTGTAATTNNLISQTWNDGSWTGTMFPDSSDLNEANILTGKHGKYAETTWSSEGTLTDAEIKQGFTSSFTSQIRWWNTQASTVTMTQIATDNNGNSTTQAVKLEDTTNHNYQYNNYGNTLVVAPDSSLTQGTIKARYDFDITGNASYNGGHAGVDIMDPSLILNYTTLSETTTTSVVYCYQKTPPTCPGQEEIEDVTEIIENINEDEWKYEETEEIIKYEPEEENVWEDDWQDDIYEEDTTYDTNVVLLTDDDFFFEEEYIEDEAYESTYVDFDEEFQLGEDDFKMEEEYFEDVETITLAYANDLTPTEYYNDVSPEEEYFTEEFDTEAFINDYIEEYTETPEEYIEEIVMKDETIEEPIDEIKEEEPLEEVAMIEEETQEEKPIPEETTNEAEIDEQPDSEELIADEPVQETEDPKQEEVVEETIEEDGPELIEESVDTDIAEAEIQEEQPEVIIDVVAIERELRAQITNKIELISATLTVVDAILSQEMIRQQPNIDSYASINNALFDNRQLPDGNMDFFNQINLESYQKTIYDDPSQLIAMVGADATVVYEQKLEEARDETDKARFKLEALLNARNNI